MGQSLTDAAQAGGRRAPGRAGGGRPSPGILAWRWFLVLSILAVGLVILVWGVKAVVGLFSSDGAGAPTSSASAAQAPVACTAADVEISLVSDSTTYVVGSLANFTITLTHIGTAPCTLDGGNVGRELLITSGADRIWSSADCDTAGAKLLLLSPGNSESTTINWATDRSAPGCATDLPAPRPGTYRAAVTTSGISSEPLVFQLT